MSRVEQQVAAKLGRAVRYFVRFLRPQRDPYNWREWDRMPMTFASFDEACDAADGLQENGVCRDWRVKPVLVQP